MFKEVTVWKTHLDYVNKVAAYFNCHKRAVQLQIMKPWNKGVKWDRVQHLKHDVTMRWHSLHSFISTYLSPLNNISKVVAELEIFNDDASQLFTEQQDEVAEFIFIVEKVWHAVRQLETNRSVSMLLPRRPLCELHQISLVLDGSPLLHNDTIVLRTQSAAHIFEDNIYFTHLYSLQSYAARLLRTINVMTCTRKDETKPPQKTWPFDWPNRSKHVLKRYNEG